MKLDGLNKEILMYENALVESKKLNFDDLLKKIKTP